MKDSSIRRGDLVTVSLTGDFGKPRPALVIQSDAYSMHPSLTILSLTSDFQNTAGTSRGDQSDRGKWLATAVSNHD